MCLAVSTMPEHLHGGFHRSLQASGRDKANNHVKWEPGHVIGLVSNMSGPSAVVMSSAATFRMCIYMHINNQNVDGWLPFLLSCHIVHIKDDGSGILF